MLLMRGVQPLSAIRPKSNIIALRPPDQRHLQDALDHNGATRWQGMRSLRIHMSQGACAIATLQANIGHQLRVCDVQPHMLLSAVAEWRNRGLAPATINKRLTILSVLGVNVSGCYATEPRKLKWWLRPADHAMLTQWLREMDDTYGDQRHALAADYIDWTVFTGLRVEESLKLVRREIEFKAGGEKASITVPGLKTVGAQQNLPIGDDACAILVRRGMREAKPDTRVFPTSYFMLALTWQACRDKLGVEAHAGASLKAIRRSAARHLTTKGMPLDILRQYLRHEDIQTTMGYLRLTGGYDESEMRRWL